MFETLGGYTFRRRWWVLAVWEVVLIAGVLFGGQLLDRLATVDSLRPDAESAQAAQRIESLVDAGPVIFAVVAAVDPYDPGLTASVTQISPQIRSVPGVVEVSDLYTSPGGQIGADNHSMLVRVELAEDLPEPELSLAEDRVRALLKQIAAPTVLVGGDHLAERAFAEQAVDDLVFGESVALVLLILALIVIFGGAVAASVPLAVAIVGVSATLLALLGVSLIVQVGEYSLNVVTLLGIGLALDYTLLIIARYREELAAGASPEQAVRVSMARAGRAVAIAGLAVVVALSGLALFAEPLLASMALGGAVVAALTTVLALTLVPALIALAGARIPPAGARTWVHRVVEAGRVRLASRVGRLLPARGRPALMVRLATLAQRLPRHCAAAATLGLIVLALPVLDARFANSDVRALPAASEPRRAYEAYQALFAPGAAPVTILATVDAQSPAVRGYLNRLNQLEEVVRLDLRTDVPAGYVVIDLIPTGETAGRASLAVVHRVRDAGADFPVQVTGPAAAVVDFQDSVANRVAYVVVIVVLALTGLLYLLTRSLVVPVKAIALNALTYLATLGMLVAIFQWGWGEPVLGFTSWGAIDLTTALLLFVFIFGLSVDYEVFLLSRMVEEYHLRRDNNAAVLAGITRTSPVVSAAAVCICIVFLGFAAGDLVAVKEIGVGMAIAVALDVTVVRGLLLPASMTLLGDLNWWTPWRRHAVTRAEHADERDQRAVPAPTAGA